MTETDPPVAPNNPPTHGKSERFPRLREFMPIIEVVGAGFIALYTLVTIALWCSSLEANKLTSRALGSSQANFQKDQRPYVWIANGKTGAPTATRLLDKRGFYQIIWTVSLSNFGKTPAYKVLGSRFIQVGTHPRAMSYLEAEITSIPTLIPPTGEVITTTISAPDITETEFNAFKILGTSQKVAIWGDYTYTDSSGVPYEMHYCLSRLNTGSISYCEGNDIK
jgi:hypothetical protein